MNRFMSEQQLHNPALIPELEASSAPKILSNFHVNKGSVAQQINSCNDEFKLLGAITESALDSENFEMLSSVYSSEPNFVKCLRSYKRVGAVEYQGRIFGSAISRRIKAAYILARDPSNGSLQAAQIDHFCLHKIVLKENQKEIVAELICAAIKWYEEHPEKNWFCKPALVYCKHFNREGYIKLPDIVCRVSTCLKNVNFNYGSECVLCVAPLERVE